MADNNSDEKKQILEDISKILGSSSSTPTKTKGVPGTVIYNGSIQENEKDSRVSGPQKYITYSNMLANVTIVAAGVRFFLNLISKAKWRTIPNPKASNQDEAQRFADIVSNMMENTITPWHRIIRRSAMYRFYGYSVQEWTAGRDDDGNMVFMDIQARPQTTIEKWGRDKNGRVQTVVQRDPATAEEIVLPRNKLVYCVDDSLNDSPEGLGLFRHLIHVVTALQRYEQLEGFGFESDLRGVPIGRAPIALLEQMVKDEDITEADKTLYLNPLTDFMKSHVKSPALGIMLDSTTYVGQGENQAVSGIPHWDVELMRSDNVTSQEAIARAIDRKNREAARVLGVEGLLLGDGDRGSEALSRDKTDNLTLIVDSTLDELAETYETDVIGELWELNGWAKEYMPTYTPEPILFRDVTKISEVVKQLSDSGAVLTSADEAVREIYELIGLTPPDPANTENELALTNPEPSGQIDPDVATNRPQPKKKVNTDG